MTDLKNFEPDVARFRHVKRGTEYEVVGMAWLQTSAPLADMEPMIVYRGEDGTLWVRSEKEFGDGRFVRIDGELTEGAKP